jgi:hypothetical protein
VYSRQRQSFRPLWTTSAHCHEDMPPLLGWLDSGSAPKLVAACLVTRGLVSIMVNLTRVGMYFDYNSRRLPGVEPGLQMDYKREACV